MLTPRDIIVGLRPCHYRYNGKKTLGDKINFGFLAQDVLEAFGDEYNFVVKDDNEEFYKINYFVFYQQLINIMVNRLIFLIKIKTI